MTSPPQPQVRRESHFWFCVYVATFVAASLNADYAIAFLSCLVVWLSRRILTPSIEPFSRRGVTILGFWYVSYLAMILLPAFFVYGNQSGPYRSTFLFAVHTLLISVPLGALLPTKGFAFRNEETQEYFKESVAMPNVSPDFLRAFRLLLGIAFALSLLYVTEVTVIPLFSLLDMGGESVELALLREEALKLLDSPFTYLYSITRGVLYPFLIVVSLGCYLQTKSKKWMWAFVMVLAAGTLFAALSLAKAPVAGIVLTLGLFLYFYHGRKLPARGVAVLVCLVLSFPMAVIMLSYDSEVDFGTALTAIGSRLFYLPAEVVYFYFEVFPKEHTYLYGHSIGKLAWLMGWEYFDTPNFVGLYGFAAGGPLETVSANGAFVADFYADFGLVGVLLGGILAGAIMQGTHIYLVRRKKTISGLAAYAFLIYAFWFLHSTSLPIVLASNGSVLVLILSTVLDRTVQSRGVEAPSIPVTTNV